MHVQMVGTLQQKKTIVAPADTISVDYSYVDFDGFGTVLDGDSLITVTSSGAWTTAISYYDGSGWISRFPTSGGNGGSTSISVSSGYDGFGRFGYITFTCGTATATVQISQYGMI